MDVQHKKELQQRRQRFMQRIGAGSIAILSSGPTHVRNRDVEYPFRVDSDFYYLTGFSEPESIAVLCPGRARGEFLLFCRERKPKEEMWSGERVGPDGARDIFGADQAFPMGDTDKILPRLMKNRTRVIHAMGRYPAFDQKIIGWTKATGARSRKSIGPPSEFVTFDQLLHDMRLLKSPYEIDLIREAAAISNRAHRQAMEVCRPGIMEYHIQAELTHQFIQSGSHFPAYPPIVASGRNARILHYTRNDKMLEDGDLLLIDAGAEYQYYASDITRTFPVNGTFTPAQRDIYQLVLAAQDAAIAKARPGNNWEDLHKAAVRVITEGLVDLGLLKGRVEKLIKKKKYKKFFMHYTGHWLGLDVHDVGKYSVDRRWRTLEPGMVITIEPGIYIRDGRKKIPTKWWDIGVRIEDNILITKSDPDVLTRALPRTIDDIEALVGQGAA
uniref:Xaa-Pro aminopeptidase n=1 Tax=Candidatus Kentrum sp. MB TaxID=2138164 RepID=A0A451B8N5_9GAMM|nr:MAG: aminopeptidase P Metallo peptidase. MEROPS family M24B [Candidatus Kentron sp. MB]VFK74656.1 MAG: aminopeptidase P Metallo peptidase. MEROPS family M24B [Candidatus Kentron sp. MB]